MNVIRLTIPSIATIKFKAARQIAGSDVMKRRSLLALFVGLQLLRLINNPLIIIGSRLRQVNARANMT